MPDSLPKLHLLLCLGADFDSAYIPHLCRHYADSVDTWMVVLHSMRDKEEAVDSTINAANQLTRALSELAPHAKVHTSTWFGEFNPFTKIERLNTLVAQDAEPGDWLLHVDADELIERPYNGFRALLRQAVSNGQKVIYGCMIDRFAPDRMPKPLRDDDDLFVKFPLSEEFTKTELKATTHKPSLMMYQGVDPLLNCHDYSGFSWRDYLRTGLPVLKVWHFKWVDGSREKLKYRVRAFKSQRIGWWNNSTISLRTFFPGEVDSRSVLRDPRWSADRHPYEQLEGRNFWKSGLDEAGLCDVWRPKWKLCPEDKVATFGSCFASHLGPALRRRGMGWLETEPAPKGLSTKNAIRFGYGMFSCRTGPITTPTLLRQWVHWALDTNSAPVDCWDKRGRVFDPFRPSIEPGGFESTDEMLLSRGQTLASMRRAILEADVFLFTLGMTESWVHGSRGWVYPACPGTVAGDFDPGQHRFLNLSYDQVRHALTEALEALWTVRPELKVLFSVSPVPLTATASDSHVLPATTGSKSILRAVAGDLSANRLVDYFPSYELVMSPTPLFGQPMFESNRRSVSTFAVERVMDVFFTAQGISQAGPARTESGPMVGRVGSQEDCDDAWAEAFVK